MNTGKYQSDMTDENMFTLRSLSVVILGEYHNPSIINPDFVVSNNIIPKSWKIVETITTPGLSVLRYANGIQVIVDPSRLTILEERNEQFLEHNSSDIHSVAAKYVNKLPHIPYRSLGLNCLVSMTRDDSKRWLTERFLKSYPWASKIYMMPKFIIDKKEKTLNLNFTYRHTSPDENSEIVIDCNTHYSGSFTSELLCEKINEWPACQNDVKTMLTTFLQGEE